MRIVRLAITALLMAIAIVAACIRVPHVVVIASLVDRVSLEVRGTSDRDPPAVEKAAESSRIPAVRPSRGPDPNSGLRVRDASVDALALFGGDNASRVNEGEFSRGRTAFHAFSPSPLSRAELMVFLN